MLALESTVDRIVNTLQSSQPDNTSSPLASSQQASQGHTTGTSVQPITATIGSSLESAKLRQLGRVEIEALGESYQRYCACQPLLLFPMEAFVDSLVNRPDSVLFAVLATALRYTQCVGAWSHDQHAHTFRQTALSLAMEDIAHGDVRLSTLQTLCLVVFFDFESKSVFYPRPWSAGTKIWHKTAARIKRYRLWLSPRC